MKIEKSVVTKFCLCQLMLIILLVGNFTFVNILPFWGHFLISILLLSTNIYVIGKFIIVLIKFQNEQYEYILYSGKEFIDKIFNQLEHDKQETNVILSKLEHLNEKYGRNITNSLTIQSDLIIQENLKMKESFNNLNDQNNKNTSELIKDYTKRIITIYDEQTKEILSRIDASLLKLTTNIEETYKSLQVQNINIEKSIIKNNEEFKSDLQKQTTEVLNSYNQKSVQLEEQNAKIAQTISKVNEDVQTIITERSRDIYDRIEQSEILTYKSISNETETIRKIIENSVDIMTIKHNEDYQNTILNLKSIDDKTIVLLKNVKDNGIYLKKQDELINESNNELKATLDSNSSNAINIISTNASLVVEEMHKIQQDIYNTAKKLTNNLETNNSETKDYLVKIEKQNINLSEDINSCTDTINNCETSLTENSIELKNIERLGNLLDKNINIIVQHSDELKNEMIKITRIINTVERINVSIDTYVNKLEKYLSEHFNEVEEQILSSQIQQGGIKDEINNLRAILDSIKKILNYNNKNENNIESYVDERTGNIVENYYEEGVLIKSIMKQQNGNVIYELLYREGNIEKSIQYNEEGKMSIEQVFFSTGEVHYRNEYTYKNGKTQKVVTEFDEIGNKLK